MQTLKEQVQNKCVHFNGVMNKECKAGVEYSKVRDQEARPFLFPCLNQGGHCDKCHFPTKEEYEKEMKELDEMCTTGITAMANVIKHIKKTGSEYGKIPCACGGLISYARSSNGHIRLNCNNCSISIIQ